jgi:hypothetical protein
MRRQVLTLGALALTFVAGCYRVHQQDGAETICFEWWIPAVAALGGIGVAVSAAYFWVRGDKKVGGLLALISLMLFILVLPSTLLNRVVIDDQHLEVTDVFFLTWEHDSVHFDEIRAYQVLVQTTETKRGPVNKYTLVLLKKDGTSYNITLKNALEPAWPYLVEQFERHGIHVVAD